jgi:predicted HD phosphohydrolase
VAWIVKVHPEFQQYYYAPHMGGVRDAREKYRDHPWFGDCVEFCEKYDQNCFDTQFEHRPLEFFLPMVDHFHSNPDAGEVGLAVDPEGIGAFCVAAGGRATG